MARLVVSAVGFDFADLIVNNVPDPDYLTIAVSVSYASTGKPVTGLKKSNFKVDYVAGSTGSVTVGDVFTFGDGFYHVNITNEFLGGAEFGPGVGIFGVKVTQKTSRGGTNNGQTVVLISTD